MTNDQLYIQHKKEYILKLVKQYNKNPNASLKFNIDEDNFDIQNTLCNSKICEKCGKCCLRYPCIFSPYDFLDLNNLDYMRNILNTGLICITRSFNKSLLILRPRGKNDGDYICNVVSDGNNSCYLCSKKGCLLPIEYRPMEGLGLYPISEEKHIELYSESDYEKEYEKYQDILKRLWCEYVAKSIPIDESLLKQKSKTLTKNIAKSNF